MAAHRFLEAMDKPAAGITVYGGSVGGSLLSELTPVLFGAAQTVISPPFQAGWILSTGSPIDLLLYIARQMCR